MGLGNLVRPSKIEGREHIKLWAIDRLVLPQADPKFQRFNVSEKIYRQCKRILFGVGRGSQISVSQSLLVVYFYISIAA
jgi:hypothetical protein